MASTEGSKVPHTGLLDLTRREIKPGKEKEMTTDLESHLLLIFRTLFADSSHWEQDGTYLKVGA